MVEGKTAGKRIFLKPAARFAKDERRAVRAPEKYRAAPRGTLLKFKNFDSIYRINRSLIGDRRGGALRDSLECLSPSDMPEPAKAKKSYGPDFFIRQGVTAICLVVFCYSAVYLVRHEISSFQAKAAYSDIQNMFNAGVELRPNSIKTMRQALVPAMAEALSAEGSGQSSGAYQLTALGDQNAAAIEKVKGLQALNKDTFGWIYVASTNISYPIMQGEDNDFYLSHNFNKSYQFSGSIFMDYRNSRDIEQNRNLIIYGHNMSDNTMFRQLLLVRDRESVFQQGYIEITTASGVYVYDIFSIYRTSPYYRYIQTDFENDDEWYNFLLEIQSKSMYRKDVKLTPESKIVTLSTCTNTPDDFRLAIHGVLREIIK